MRRVAAGEGIQLPVKYMGHLFEQYVGLELVRYANLTLKRVKIRYWRDANGPEVDWVIDAPGVLIPIEVKWADHVNINDAKHLKSFLSEYDEAHCAYVICRIPFKQKLAENIYALPWQDISDLFSDFYSK